MMTKDVTLRITVRADAGPDVVKLLKQAIAARGTVVGVQELVGDGFGNLVPEGSPPLTSAAHALDRRP